MAYACIAVSLIAVAVNKGRDKDVVNVAEKDCVDVAEKLGEDCRYWNDTFNK